MAATGCILRQYGPLKASAAGKCGNERRAFATVAVSETPELARPYLMSALALGRALLELGSRYLLLVLIGRGDKQGSSLIQQHCPNCIPLEVEPIYKAVEFPVGWGWAYTKFRLWELDYDKIVFLDADVAIMKDVDPLFEFPALSMARNRCGMCCSHAEGSAGTYSSGVMVLHPNSRDQARLHQALAGEWVSEQYLIQGVLPVAAELPDVDNIFTTEVLASCGCRPHQLDDGSYVSSLTVTWPFQHNAPFDTERIYFPGVVDAEVRTAHLHNPKPWLPNAATNAPCGKQFYVRWLELLGNAMTTQPRRTRRNASSIAAALLRDSFTRELCRYHRAERRSLLDAGFSNEVAGAPSAPTATCRSFEDLLPSILGNGTFPADVLDTLASCPAGALRDRLWAATRILWAKETLTAGMVRAANRLVLRGFLGPLSSPSSTQRRARRLSTAEEACVFKFAYIVRRRLDEEHGQTSGIAAVGFSFKLTEVVCALPSCYEDKKRDCCLIEAIDMVKRFVSVGLYDDAARLFQSLQGKGPWRIFWQLPVWFSKELPSRPVWNTAAHLDADDFVTRIVSAIAFQWKHMHEELQKLLRLDPSASVHAYPDLNQRTGNWTKVMLYDGEMGMFEHHIRDFHYGGVPYPPRKLHPLLCKHLKVTCSTLEGLIPGIIEPRLPYIQADQEQVNFFTLLPGSRIHWHSGASNGRLTIHTCLAGCGGDSFIQVGPERLRWPLGKPVVFDDSYLHYVQVDPALQEPRTILHVMVTHPQIDTMERYLATNPEFLQPFWPESNWEVSPA